MPLGAPLDLQFRFDVTPDLEHGLTEDYRVFVHFLDDREEVLWTEDHDLPVPTSQWRSGQSIEYERRVKIPMYPYVGESVIAAGLYSVVDGTPRAPRRGGSRPVGLSRCEHPARATAREQFRRVWRRVAPGGVQRRRTAPMALDERPRCAFVQESEAGLEADSGIRRTSGHVRRPSTGCRSRSATAYCASWR